MTTNSLILINSQMLQFPDIKWPMADGNKLYTLMLVDVDIDTPGSPARKEITAGLP
jgi:hypothetical protein